MKSILVLLAFSAPGLLLAGCLSSPRPQATPTSQPAASPSNPAPIIMPDGLPPHRVAPEPNSSQDVAAYPALAVRLVTDQVEEPTSISHAGDGSGRLFFLERRGRIRVIQEGLLQAEPFLDIVDSVESTGLEQGLLGLAFHPRFPEDRRLFIDYVDKAGDVVIAGYQVTPDLKQVDGSSAKNLLTVEQFFMDHKGGQLAFGPDGYLYIGVGEGGLGQDPPPDLLLGKVLRLDVDSGDPYAIPADNPFVDEPGYRPETWLTGLRNPWRFSFDRLTGDMYIGENGENLYEEINFVPAGSPGGLDFGWRTLEGTHCFESETCDSTGFTPPLVEYGHGLDCSVQGGYVYRGSAYPSLEGVYLFGDYCSGKIWGLRPNMEPDLLADTILNISSFGEDEAGELYIADLFQGNIYRVVVPADEPLTNWPGAWPVATELAVPLEAEFEGGVRLVGYNTNRPLASPGGVVGITLFWQGQSIPETSTVFVQVRDEANSTVVQADHPLYLARDLLLPDGATLRDGVTLSLPPDLPAGSYRVLVGFYDPASGSRLGVVDDQSGENAVLLAEFKVAK